MNIKYIGGFFVGTLFLSLLLVFFIKPAFLSSDSDVSERNNIVQEQQSTTQNNDQLQSNQKKDRRCDQTCVLDVIERLKTNQNLRNEYGPNIQDTIFKRQT